MKLNVAQLESVVFGAQQITEEDGLIRFHRFTEAEEKWYEKRNTAFYKKCFTDSGIQLRFRTDSRFLKLKGTAVAPTARCFYSVELYVNGEKKGEFANFDLATLPQDYISTVFPTGEFDETFHLEEGEKDLVLHLPWDVAVSFSAIELEDGASVIPLPLSKKILVYGDSITQGYDALHPSQKYVSLLADWLQAQEYNKAIGGEVFCPELVEVGEGMDPDYILVAYGTNDWSKSEGAVFLKDCEAFFAILNQRYPKAKKIVLTPIWRKDYQRVTRCKPFHEHCADVCAFAEKMENCTIVDGWPLVPHDSAYFSDLRLHPNEEGYRYYFENLKKALEKAWQ